MNNAKTLPVVLWILLINKYFLNFLKFQLENRFNSIKKFVIQRNDVYDTCQISVV